MNTLRLWVTVLLVLPACTASHNPAAGGAEISPPNVILVLADDLGVGDLSINGSPIRTPNIDALARKGVRFTNFYASANVCSPSRAGLLTGRYAIRMGLAHKVIDANSGKGIPADEVTLAEELKQIGYRTALVGKWHLGDEQKHLPTRHGFDEFFGVLYSNDMRPFSLYKQDRMVEETIDQSTLTKRYTDRVLELINQTESEPYFIMLSHTFPHYPLFASSAFKGKSAAGIYGDAVEEIDASLGKIVEAASDNTVIIFTSDNGAWFEGSNANLRGLKGHTYDAGYRVPLIIRWPDQIPASGEIDGLAVNTDLLPTVLDLHGIERKPSGKILDGKSLWGMLKRGESSPHEYVYLFNNEDVVGVRSERWKYLSHAYYRDNYAAFENFEKGFGFAYPQLFQINDVTAENYSVASNYPKVVQKMKTILQEAKAEFEPLRTVPAAAVVP